MGQLEVRQPRYKYILEKNQQKKHKRKKMSSSSNYQKVSAKVMHTETRNIEIIPSDRQNPRRAGSLAEIINDFHDPEQIRGLQNSPVLSRSESISNIINNSTEEDNQPKKQDEPEHFSLNIMENISDNEPLLKHFSSIHRNIRDNTNNNPD